MTNENVPLVPEQNADQQHGGEFLLGGRIVPVRREGNKVFVRSLGFDEEDTGQKAHLGPGDRLVFEAGALVIDSRQVDSASPLGRGGYAPVANTVWTWYQIIGDADLSFVLFLRSFARRVDAAHVLWTSVMQEREKAQDEQGIQRRARFLGAFATAEVAIIALHRGIDMAYTVVEKYCPDLEVPDGINKIRTPITEIRHAFEHIDERAQGKVGMSGKEDLDALTIFHQPDFGRTSVIRYKEHSLNFEEDVLRALLDCRQFIMEVVDARAATRRASA